MPVPPYHPDIPQVRKDWAHYYDQITKMDARAGEILDELERSGEADNTIVFYYSDHGGTLPRFKRYMFESGLRVPLIVYFPPNYTHLAPKQKRADRLVSFVDFAPTVLSLAGIAPPDYMHGKAFLGEHATLPRTYIHAYRGRMDERYDLVRAVRDKEFLYVHNYMPQRIYGQHLSYLWKAPSMQSWHEEYQNGRLPRVQRRFFEPKPAEELYKVSEDPHNIRNLASDSSYQEVLQRMRRANRDWMVEQMDLGFIPEGRINSLREGRSLYEAVREKDVPISQIIETAELASWGRTEDLDELAKQLDHRDPSVRFWAATGFSVADPASQHYKGLLNHLDDPSPAVRIAIAEALFRYGDQKKALETLERSLDEPGIFIKLRALNTIEALSPQRLTPGLTEKLKVLTEEYNTGNSAEKYIFRAAKGLLIAYDKR